MKRKVTLRFKLLLLLACVVYAGVVLVNQVSVVQAQKAEKAELTRQLKEITYEQSYLENKLAYINTIEYIEEAARERFGWVRPDEKVYEGVDETP